MMQTFLFVNANYRLQDEKIIAQYDAVCQD